MFLNYQRGLLWIQEYCLQFSQKAMPIFNLFCLSSRVRKDTAQRPNSAMQRTPAKLLMQHKKHQIQECHLGPFNKKTPHSTMPAIHSQARWLITQCSLPMVSKWQYSRTLADPKAIIREHSTEISPYINQQNEYIQHVEE